MTEVVITFLKEPTEEQLKMAQEFAKAYELENPEAKVLIGSLIPPRK